METLCPKVPENWHPAAGVYPVRSRYLQLLLTCAADVDEFLAPACKFSIETKNHTVSRHAKSEVRVAEMFLRTRRSVHCERTR